MEECGTGEQGRLTSPEMTARRSHAIRAVRCESEDATQSCMSGRRTPLLSGPWPNNKYIHRSPFGAVFSFLARVPSLFPRERVSVASESAIGFSASMRVRRLAAA